MSNFEWLGGIQRIAQQIVEKMKQDEDKVLQDEARHCVELVRTEFGSSAEDPASLAWIVIEMYVWGTMDRKLPDLSLSRKAALRQVVYNCIGAGIDDPNEICTAVFSHIRIAFADYEFINRFRLEVFPAYNNFSADGRSE